MLYRVQPAVFIPSSLSDASLSGSSIRARVRFEPCEQRTYAARGDGHTGIRCAVIQVDRVSVRADRLSAGEYNVADISAALVRSFWTKHPGVSSLQADIWTIEIKEGKA